MKEVFFVATIIGINSRMAGRVKDVEPLQEFIEEHLLAVEQALPILEANSSSMIKVLKDALRFAGDVNREAAARATAVNKATRIANTMLFTELERRDDGHSAGSPELTRVLLRLLGKV